jgi:GNAT superfamily N-acetyltransferase
LLSWRPRTPEDDGLVRALFAALRRAELDMLGQDPDQQAAFVDLQLRARDHHRDAAYPDARLGVLTLDDMAVGQLDIDVSDAAIDLLELHVIPGLRGHGLGEAALGALLADADAAGLPVRLHVEVGSPARRLYERHGFRATEVGPVHVAMERPAVGGPGRPPPPVGAAAPTTAPAETADAAPIPSFPTFDDLAPHVGATVACGDGPALELVAVDLLPGRAPQGRVPYSALLAGPLDHPLRQGSHRLDLPTVGPTEVFLVPIEPVDGRARYEMLVT